MYKTSQWQHPLCHLMDVWFIHLQLPAVPINPRRAKGRHSAKASAALNQSHQLQEQTLSCHRLLLYKLSGRTWLGEGLVSFKGDYQVEVIVHFMGSWYLTVICTMIAVGFWDQAQTVIFLCNVLHLSKIKRNSHLRFLVPGCLAGLYQKALIWLLKCHKCLACRSCGGLDCRLWEPRFTCGLSPSKLHLREC